MLLISYSSFAQEQVFNVQKYCVDELPFKKGQCDITGNEYSWVFLDETKKNLTFFFTDMKLKYKIVSANASEFEPDQTVYILENDKGQIEMKINKAKTRIEFIYPNNIIYLTVGKSTKLESKS